MILVKAKKLVRRLMGNQSPRFATNDVVIGRNVSFGKNVVFNCQKVRIGDGVVFQANITINAETFEIGDYGTIYDNCFFPGPGELKIGHNFWLGTGSIVDAKGGTTIGNNVGIGAHSQLWTHMIYGDVMYGCRFHSTKSLTIGNDVWLVGHCLVSPVTIGDRSIAMLGSLITKDMAPDSSYAGVPAKDITDKMGSQFAITEDAERVTYLEGRLREFAQRRGLEGNWYTIVTDSSALSAASADQLAFDVTNRTYAKRGTRLEHDVIRFLLPEAKFVPARKA